MRITPMHRMPEAFIPPFPLLDNDFDAWDEDECVMLALNDDHPHPPHIEADGGNF